MRNDISDNWIAYNIFCCCRIFGWVVVFNGNTKKGTRMNANELADRLVDYHDSFLAKDCATMLRQQQAEIAKLKAHPVKEQLTDEDVERIAGENAVCFGGQPLFLLRFARALLKEAQEK